MKKIVFITGTRADYGKIKSIMKLIQQDKQFQLSIFVTGMHMHTCYGSTYQEIEKDGFDHTYHFINQRSGTPMDLTLSNTISGFSDYVAEEKPDLIVVHGDRLEALAGALVGAMNNILVAHIEGGEVSGTIDESLRHAITKISHAHFVANEEAKKRIIQLGENDERIFVIGSPDIDVMLHAELPALESVKEHYGIAFDAYSIVMFHPVTTSHKLMAQYAKNFVDALLKSEKNYVVIHPNNDWGRDFIIEEYERLKGNEHFRIFSSIRFEYFLRLLKEAKGIIGNSSAGVREAGVYAVPAVDIGDRQKRRYDEQAKGIIHTDYDTENILQAIKKMETLHFSPYRKFGTGNSAEKFLEIIKSESFWNMDIQKVFIDID